MKLNKKNTICVIGGNAAGPAAAAKAKRLDPSSEIILFEGSPFISTGTCELPYLFNNTIDDYKKIVFFDEKSFLKEKGVLTYVNSFVSSINRKNKSIIVYDKLNNTNKNYFYDKLILTTGSVVLPLPKLSNDLSNFASLKSVSDYIKISEKIKSGKLKNILIIGAGLTGLELADTLADMGYEVTIIESRSYPLENFDDFIRNSIVTDLNNKGINFIGGVNDVNFIISDNVIKFAKVNGKPIHLDFLIQTTGVKPNNFLALSSGLELGTFGGLKLDSRLKTSDPNIFAAGDNIEVTNFITKKKDYMPLASLARQYGYIAGTNAVGGNDIAQNIVKNTTFKFADKTYAFVGLTLSECKLHNINVLSFSANGSDLIKVMPNSKNIYGNILIGKNSGLIVGASFVGSNLASNFADIISIYITNNLKGENLSEINFNYSPPVSNMINLLNILGQKIKKGK